MKKIYQKIIITLIFLISFLILGTTVSNASLHLKNLDFNVVINENGDMEVEETWNIRISDTNTLFKTFELDNSKYSEITDVTVREIDTDNTEKEFLKIYEEMYHVTKDCYYAMVNSNDMYEIAWGVDIDSTKTKIYKIKYTVKDCITGYDDCAELYWQFIGNDFEIDADMITGTITLPKDAINKEDIRVWAHGPLQGNIEITSLNTVSFEVPEYEYGKYVEIRLAIPSNMFYDLDRTEDKDMIENIIIEETEWAEEANRQREREILIGKIIGVVLIVVSILLSILLISKIIKYVKILKETPKKKPTTEIEYYRDFPGENSTAAESAFLYYFDKGGLELDKSKIIAGTLLNLSLKEYIKFDVEDKKTVRVTLLPKVKQKELKEDEKIIYDYLGKIKDGNSFTMKEFKKYIEKHSSDFLSEMNKIKKATEKEQVEQKNYDLEERKKYNSWEAKCVIYVVLGMFSLFAIPVAVLAIVDAVLAHKIANRFNGLTQKGLDEKEQWKALKKYMEDFSMLDEREVPELVLWEKYLVFATVFGIADKVLEQIKIKYPQIENETNLNSTTYMHLMYNGSLNTNFIKTINSSVTKAYTSANYSSGSGSSGGFSGGGGFGGRRPEAAVDASFKRDEL